MTEEPINPAAPHPPPPTEEAPATAPELKEGAKMTSKEVLEQQIAEEEEHFEHRSTGLFLSSLSAGLDIGFGPFLMAVVLTFAGGELSEPVTRILIANAYSLGFVFVVMGGTALFTEHTSLAVLPVLGGRATLRQMGRLWGVIYSGNIVGAAAFAALAAIIGPALGVIQPAAFGLIADHLVDHAWWVMLLSAVLAGWMMGLLSWLVASGRDTVSQLLFVWLVTTAIGLARLHHSIAGTVEVLMSVFSRQGTSLGEFGWFLLWTTIGNAIGGVIFVALIKYGSISQSSPQVPEPGIRYYDRPR